MRLCRVAGLCAKCLHQGLEVLRAEQEETQRDEQAESEQAQHVGKAAAHRAAVQQHQCQQ